MKSGTVVALAAAAALFTVASPRAQADHSHPGGDPISGVYSGTFKSAVFGDMQATLELKNVHGTISGKLTMRGHAPLAGSVDGTYDGGKLALTFALGDHGEHHGTITASLAGDRITGSWDSDGNGGAVDVRRGERATTSARNASLHPYAAYESLIGQWDVAPESGGAPVAGAVFRWGPNHSYIWSAGTLLVNGSEEPHFEGLLMWNGIHKNLDALLAVDLQHGLAQEQGTFSAEPDGSFVREITATFSEGVQPIGRPVTGPEGATGHFRQTFRPLGTDKFATAVMRETETGWVATFPGSDHLVMTRRPAAS